MSLLPHLADRCLNRPLLITPDKAQVILGVLAGRIGVDAPRADRFEGDPFERDEDGRIVVDDLGFAKLAPYRVTDDGIAIVSIVGSLVNRGAYVGASSGLVSYEGIKHQSKAAMTDDRVQGVLIDLHTSGGEGIGAFEAATMIADLSAAKPTIAVVNGIAASAGYALASGAREIVTTQTGAAGSIGVLIIHADHSRQIDEEGITPTLIYAGAHKVDGNPLEPLPETVRDDLQAEVDIYYDQFVQTVARHRDMTPEAVRATEARTFIGPGAVDAGLADRVGTFESALEDLRRAMGGRASSTQRRPVMDDIKEDIAPTTSTQQATATALTEAREAGAREERTRIMTIIGHESIRGDGARMAAACDLAVKAPGMSADDVVGFVTDNMKPADPQAGYRLRDRETDADPLGAAPGGSRSTTALSDAVARTNARRA